MPKSTQQLATLETDLNYHNALNEHVKYAYPNINALSPDMLRELSIPTEILGKQQVPRARGKEEKKGDTSITSGISTARRNSVSRAT